MKDNNSYKRIIVYIATFFSLFIGYIVVRAHWFWQGSTDLHTLMEVMATLLAVFVGIVALLSYYTSRSIIFLLLGVGFLGTGFLDGYHAIVTSRWFGYFFPSPPDSLIPWSWIASRLFLSVSMFFSWFFWYKRKEWNAKITERIVYISFFLFTLISFLFFAIIPLPQAYYPNFIFGRPEELIPALFFFLALVGYLSKGKWREDIFEHWVVISLLVGFVSQAMLMSFSTALFDLEFNLAHLLKIFSYLIIFIGLFVTISRVFKNEKNLRANLQKQAEKFAKETEIKELALQELRDKEKVLEKKVAELENTKLALMNIAEDLEEEKKKTIRAKAKDEAILLSLGEGLVVTDRHGKIVLVNPAFEKMLGLKEKNVIGKKLIDVISVSEKGKEFSKDDCLIDKALEGKSITTELEYKRKDGTVMPVFVIITPVFIGGKVVGAVEVFRDISKEKAIDKAKTEFVSLASHQLRTPLSAINWYTEMLLSGDAGKISNEQKEYLQEIYSSNKRMVELVNALLNVSRLELGTFAVDPRETDIVKLAHEVVRELRPEIKEHKVKFKSKYDKVPKIMVDPKLLHIVLQNLLNNSIKYTPPGGEVVFEIKNIKKGKQIDRRKFNQDGVLIKVSDTGLGIPKDQQDKIFTKLFRADNVRVQDVEGTGLGLYIVKSIIDHSGGKIWFRSKENKGTTFYVFLPLAGMKKKQGKKSLLPTK